VPFFPPVCVVLRGAPMLHRCGVQLPQAGLMAGRLCMRLLTAGAPPSTIRFGWPASPQSSPCNRPPRSEADCTCILARPASPGPRLARDSSDDRLLCSNPRACKSGPNRLGRSGWIDMIGTALREVKRTFGDRGNSCTKQSGNRNAPRTFRELRRCEVIKILDTSQVP